MARSHGLLQEFVRLSLGPAVWVLLAGCLPIGLAAQALPRWGLAPSSEIEVGVSVEIYRPRDAALHSSGLLVIADAGNNRLLTVGPDGRLLRTIGQEGSGPGEFEYPVRIAILGDTIVAYDAGQSRVSVFLIDGSHLVTRSLPSLDGGLVEFWGAVTSTQYVGTVRMGEVTATPGLRMRRSAIVMLDVAQGSSQQLATRDWQYIYTYTDANGSTGYGTPFLGTTQVCSVGQRIGVVVRGAPKIEFLDAQGVVPAPRMIPVREVPPARSAVAIYRDSLLDEIARSNRPFPGAAERVREVFGSRFPIPNGEMAPAVEELQAVGDEFWLRAVAPAEGQIVSWYAVDARTGELTRQIDVPRTWAVLGGTNRKVIVTLRDELDVEYVRVYAIHPAR